MSSFCTAKATHIFFSKKKTYSITFIQVFGETSTKCKHRSDTEDCDQDLHCWPLIQHLKTHRQVVKWTVCFRWSFTSQPTLLRSCQASQLTYFPLFPRQGQWTCSNVRTNRLKTCCILLYNDLHSLYRMCIPFFFFSIYSCSDSFLLAYRETFNNSNYYSNNNTTKCVY